MAARAEASTLGISDTQIGLIIIRESSTMTLVVDLHFITSNNVSKTIPSQLIPTMLPRLLDGSTEISAITVSLKPKCACGLCDAGSYSDGSKPCRSCTPGWYSSIPGSVKCERCSAETFSASSGATACQKCPAWETTTGLSGMKTCYARDEPPPSPYVVQITLGSPMAKSNFTPAVQYSFRGALAAAAVVDILSVQIRNIENTARRASGSNVNSEIGAPSQGAASSMANGLTEDKINAEMAKAGLPGTTLAGIVIAKNPRYPNSSTTISPNATDISSFWNRKVGPLSTWLWITIGGTLALAFFCCAVAAFIMKKRKSDPKDQEKRKVDADTLVLTMKEKGLPLAIERDSTTTVQIEGDNDLSDESDDNGKDSGKDDDKPDDDDDPENPKPEKEPKNRPSIQCKFCGKKMCKPTVDLSVRLHNMLLLKMLNDREGWVSKVFEQRKMCAVELETGQTVTVLFKNVRCSEPKERPPKITSAPDDTSSEAGSEDGDGASCDAGSKAPSLAGSIVFQASPSV
jgi:hypothetical protein